MKPPRTESRWAKMKRWADEQDASKRAAAEQVHDYKRQQAEAKQREKQKEERIRAVALALLGLSGVIWVLVLATSGSSDERGFITPSPVSVNPVLSLVAVLPALSAVPVLLLLIRKIFGPPKSAEEKLCAVFLACLLSLFPSWMLCVNAALWANEFLDTGAIQVVRTSVASKNITTHKGSHSYFLSLREWNLRREGGAPSLSVSPEHYNSTPEGTPVLVYTKPGALGIEWMMRYSIR